MGQLCRIARDILTWGKSICKAQCSATPAKNVNKYKRILFRCGCILEGQFVCLRAFSECMCTVSAWQWVSVRINDPSNFSLCHSGLHLLTSISLSLKHDTIWQFCVNKHFCFSQHLKWLKKAACFVLQMYWRSREGELFVSWWHRTHSNYVHTRWVKLMCSDWAWAHARHDDRG